MKRWMATLSMLAFGAPVAAAAAAPAEELISFEIQDQFKRKHRDTDFRGRVLVLVGSGRKGSQFNDAWESAIHDALEERGADEGVAAGPPSRSATASGYHALLSATRWLTSARLSPQSV